MLKRTIFKMLLHIFILLTSLAWGSDQTIEVDTRKWFFYLGSGLSRPVYDAQIQDAITFQRNNGGQGVVSALLDVPTVYFKFKPNFYLGPALKLMIEDIAGDWRNQASYSVQTLSLDASAMWFWDKLESSGPFLRIDLGPTQFKLVRESPAGLSINETYGVLYEVGLGYSWKASMNSRIMVHLNYFGVMTPDHFSQGPTFEIGFLL